MFKAVSPKINFAELEEEILAYWKKNQTFEKSVEKDAPHGEWTFLDGPPFVTGMPHYGSLLSSLPKDVFGRYWTMKGYKVRRVWGWDGHGLPIENKVEGELDIKRKKDIEEKIGIEKFIARCLHYVNQVSDEWEWYVDHIGRWVDFKHAYKTWDLPYMESVMWVFKQMYEKGYIYKGLRVSLYCPHCATPISNFEVAMDADNYKELTDAATTYKYALVGEKNTYILAWSTTPWNKIVTPALAVNPKLTYVKVKQGDEQYILAKTTLKMLDKDIHPELVSGSTARMTEEMPKQVQDDKEGKPYEILEEFKGSSLIGKKFVPHYDYYKVEPGEKAFVIVGGDFVTADEGTGVVTIAAYGEEDLKVMKQENIHIEMHLDEEGTIKEDVPKFGGMYYLKANKAVNADLAERGLIYKDEDLPHNVPLCWRCHTRLYYAPMDAWYVNVQILKEQMQKTNELVQWFPSHFKHGRFLKSLENAPDWNISRNRYWGSPVPVWECECEERFVPGSLAELEKRSGQKITNLHKPDIDEVEITCEKCGKKVKRVEEVLDSWIESGSASFAERHYPFEEGQPPLESFYPPDYIAEYTGQIRAWFYVLHVIANALDLRKDGQNILSKNVSVTGVILGTDGRKMSKNFGNYPDPKLMLQKYGGDALRLYLLGSPVMHGEDIIISEEQYRNQVKGLMLILWNTYNFFITYANIDRFQISNFKFQISNNVLDQWILSLLHGLIENVTKDLDDFDTVEAIAKMQKFINDFSTWYIRRSRDRVGLSVEDETDKYAFYQTTHTVLTKLSELLAPITPFISESIYKNLTNSESVHLTEWPIVDKIVIDKKLEKEMEIARLIVQEGHAKRKIDGKPVRQALEKLPWRSLLKKQELESVRSEIWNIILEELNIFNIAISGKFTYPKPFKDVSPEVLEQLEQKRSIIRKIQEERKKLGTAMDEKVNVTLADWPQSFEDEIKRKALINQLSKGESFAIERV